MHGFLPTRQSLSVALLLNLYAITLVSGSPTSLSSLKPREDDNNDDPIDGPDHPLPENLKPAAKSSHLPDGDVKKAIQEFDSVVDPEGYKDWPDYDPDQDPSNHKKKRQIVALMPRRGYGGWTDVLRSVGVSVPEGISVPLELVFGDSNLKG